MFDGTKMVCMMREPDNHEGKQSLGAAINLYKSAGTKFKLTRKGGDIWLWRDVAGYRSGDSGRMDYRYGEGQKSPTPKVWRKKATA